MNTHSHEPPRVFHPTFTGGRQEKEWILHSLRGFHADEWFTDVLYRVKGGKEATVYCCSAQAATGVDLIAAKVFRPRMFRAMKNDSLYKTGRLIRSAEGRYPDSRTARALRKRSRYGIQLDAGAWCQHEVEMLETLHAAGADVPRVLTSSENAILMEFVGDERQGAPTLQTVTLPADEARRVHERLIENLRTLLRCFVVHGDLSPYNVLHWQDEIRVIDLPQAVDALAHPQAFDLFRRDVRHLSRWSARHGVAADAEELSIELWREAFR